MNIRLATKFLVFHVSRDDFVVLGYPLLTCSIGNHKGTKLEMHYFVSSCLRGQSLP